MNNTFLKNPSFGTNQRQNKSETSLSVRLSLGEMTDKIETRVIVRQQSSLSDKNCELAVCVTIGTTPSVAILSGELIRAAGNSWLISTITLLKLPCKCTVVVG